VEEREGDDQDARAPRGLRVAYAVARLHHVGAAGEAAREGPQQLRRDGRVGVHHHHRVRGVVPLDRREGVGEGVALPAALGVAALEHLGARSQRHACRRVRAVVRDDHDAPQLGRIVEGPKAVDRRADAGRFVVGGHHDVEAGESQLGWARRSSLPRRDGQHEEVERCEEHRQGRAPRAQLRWRAWVTSRHRSRRAPGATACAALAKPRRSVRP
jgi:hypothetical protein